MTSKVLKDLSPTWLEGKYPNLMNLEVSMVNRQIKLMSEEWNALLFLQMNQQEKTGVRPSVNEVIGKSIIKNAQDIGYQDDSRESKQ